MNAMGFTLDGFNRAKSKMLGDFNEALANAEALRQAELEAFDTSFEPAPAAVGEGSPGDGASLAGATGTIANAVAVR